MKSVVKRYGVILALLALIGCSNSENTTAVKADGVLKPVKQSEENTQMTTLLGFDTFFLYELEVKNTEMLYVTFWIEHYIDGEKQENIAEGMTSASEEMTLAASKLDFALEDGTKYVRWNLGMTDGTSTTSMETIPEEVETSNLGSASTWLDDKINIEAEKPQALAIIVKDGSKGMRVGMDEEVLQKIIKENHEVIIVKAMITNKEL
ncbi:hypothetical protein [Ferdinandcohnia sp. Marseille-Q9671]